MSGILTQTSLTSDERIASSLKAIGVGEGGVGGKGGEGGGEGRGGEGGGGEGGGAGVGLEDSLFQSVVFSTRLGTVCKEELRPSPMCTTMLFVGLD